MGKIRAATGGAVDQMPIDGGIKQELPGKAVQAVERSGAP
jgi:hypothetical protein